MKDERVFHRKERARALRARRLRRLLQSFFSWLLQLCYLLYLVLPPFILLGYWRDMTTGAQWSSLALWSAGALLVLILAVREKE